ncbi:proliferation marker protein Ki-67 [Psammomys obesus]|uniref:proliferation marker protein Ki-67 n=1 Tax=Psammomys obesus TaxID=48139 RepID=UPI00245287B9|nr:proliferation marker protein Ki-67 [Psammomys obesus]
MESSARLVTIKRNGDDGAHFPLSLSSCLFGRSIECDIRIQLPVVSKKHCKIQVKEQEAILYNFSSTNPTQVNGATIDEPVQLKHGDIITIIDRSFRYENRSHEDGNKSTEFPGKSLGQEPARRASRASFSADPDGKGQDAKASEITASGRSVVNAETLTGDSPASGGSKDSVTQDLSGHLERHSSRESTSGDISKKSKATGSGYRKLKSSPAHSLSNSKKNESPFKELYQSLKEELVVKSQKHRKSEPQPHCAGGKESETQLLVSCKARPKSSGNIPVTATSSPEVEMICTEKQTGGVESVQTPMEALNSSFSLSETTKTKTLVRKSQQLKDEDFHAIGGKESVNPGESEGAKSVHKIVTPRKLLTRNQTSVKIEDAASFVDTPENPSSRKRSSFPARVEVLPAETQKRLSSTPGLASGEKKTPKNAFSKPEKLATAAEQICSGLPGLSSVDISNFGDSINKSEGMSLKRRRVSFGGCLRPELFDENLPPNTPLKRGETPAKRKSLATHSPAVLKKIIKEPPKSPRQQESAGGTPPRANDQRRGSVRTSPASSGSKSLYQTDTPKKSGRKSNNLPAKRASISRGQHGILQMISSKRRSGASEANLIVKKSWADVVKLGAKQTQTKVVKHAPQKQMSKRQRRPSTPKKPTSNLHNQFSTGHANSPCTIVIGRTQIEKVSVPARPYKMLSKLMLNRKMDFSEDLSGLTEMFKTPVKEKQQQMTDMDSILPNSDNLPEKQFQVTSSGGTPLPITSEILGENVPSSTQNAAKEPSDTYSASPTLKRRSIKNGSRVQIPKNVHNITHLEKKTPGSDTELLETASSVSRTRRSRQLRHTLEDSMNEKTEADLADGITGKHLRKTSLRGQEVDQQVQDCENSSQRCKENTKLKEGSEKTLAMRSSAREQKLAKDLIRSQMVTQTGVCAEELLNQEQGTTHNPEESMHMQSTPEGDVQEATKQKVDPAVYAAKVKCCLKTPDKKTQLLEGPAGLKEIFETPNCRDELIDDDETKVPCKYPQLTADNTRTSAKARSSMSGKKADVKKELPALTKLVHVSGGARHSPKVPELEHGDIKALKEYESKMLTPTITRSRRSLRKTEEKPQLLEDLTGFQELFLSPVPGDKIIKMPSKSPYSESVRTPASTKRLSKMGPRVNVRELSVLEKESPGRATGTPAPMQEENDTTVFMETPKQKLDFTGSSVGSKRRSRTPKIRAPPLEDLAGSPELFQTPAGASDPVTVGETDPVTVGETTKMSLESSEPGHTRTQASTKTLSKTGLGKVDVKDEPSTLGKQTASPGRATRTPRTPVQKENDATAFMETPKQKLDFTGNSVRSKRRSRTPKIRAPPLEDLAGFPELFQTPAGASDPVTVGETTKMARESPQPEPVRTPASTKRLSKMSHGKVDVKKELSPLNKPRCASQEVMHTPRLPEDDGRGAKDVKKSVAQTLDSAVHVTHSKRQQGACKKRSQSSEDLSGLQELFQTPGHDKISVAGNKLTKMSCRFLPLEPKDTSVTSQIQPKINLRNLVKNEVSGDRMLPQISGEILGSPRVPEGEGRVIRTRKQPVKRKLDTAVSVPDSKRQRVARAEKAQTREHLSGFQELYQDPGLSMDSVTVDKTTKMPNKSPESVEMMLETQPRRRLRRLGVAEEPRAQRKTTRVVRETRNTQKKEPMGDSKGVKEFKESSMQKQDPAVSLTGKRNQPRMAKKTQPLEELISFQEETSVRMSCQSPQPEEKETSAASKRLFRTQLCKVDVKEEPTTQRKPPGRETRSTLKEPVSDAINVEEELKASTKRKIDLTTSMPVNKRPRRVPREKAQSLELAGLKGPIQTPGHTEESVSDKRSTQMPCNFTQTEQVDSLQISPRRPRTRRGKVEVNEESSVLKKTMPTSRQTMRSRKVPEIDDKGTEVSKESVKQKLDTEANVTGSRRRPRAHKDEVQPLEVLSDSKEITQISDHSEKLRHDTQMPDSVKPLRTCRRVLRTSKEEPMEMSVDTRELAASQIKSNTFLPPKRTSARDGSVSRARVLRSVTQKQEATDEKPVPKTQRAARSKRHVSPEPVKKRHLRTMSNKIEPVEEQISNIRKTEEKEDKGENSVTPDQKTPQSSRSRKKTNEKQLRPKIDGSADKVGITKNEKTIKSSQETELQNPDDGAKKSTSRGRASGKRTCLKSRGQSEIPQPYASEEKTHEPDTEIVIKTQKERGVSGHSDVRSLRSKKAGATLDTELKPRVTRGAKKDAKIPKQDEDIVYTRKLRTRSHQNSENK